MTMDKAEIVIDYRRAANKQKQIKVLAQLNQCAERKIAEILVDAGEELPKKWQVQLLKPAMRSRKYQETEAEAPEAEPPEAPEDLSPAPMAAEESREEDPSTPAAPPLRMTGRAEAVLRASLTAGTKEEQIKALAELNQCSERRIAEILAAEGFESAAALVPEAPAEPAPMAAEPVTDRDIFEAVASVLPDGSREKAATEAVPTAAPEKTATVTLDPTVWDRGALERKIEPGEISAERLLREACRMLTSALELEPDRYHTYSCGVLDLVHALTEE